VRFIRRDLRAWVPDEKYDALLSFDALEHIEDPEAFLRKMTEFVVPGGVAVLAFGPLFHSPFGDHMLDFFRLQIPWRGSCSPSRPCSASAGNASDPPIRRTASRKSLAVST